MGIARAIILLLLAQGLAGCNDSHSSPFAPSPPGGTVPLNSRSLLGYVRDTANRAVAGAIVNVVDGPQAGASTTTNAEGRFFYSGAVVSPLTFRASKDGYIARSETSQSAPGATPWVYIQLEVVAPPVEIAGDYTLTLVADTSCGDIPSELRTRTYASTIASRPNPLFRPDTMFTLTASGAPFLENYASIPVGVAGDYAAFSVYHGEGFGLVEQIAPKTFLAYYGDATASVGTSAPSTISASFNGVIEYCVFKSEMGANYDCTAGSADALVQCTSKNHRLVLTRR